MTDTAPAPEDERADHPAQWSEPVLDQLFPILDRERTRVGRPLAVIDPFAGVGRVRLASALAETAVEVVGVELQAEWVDDDGTQMGDATDLWQFAEGSFDAVVTSPCYGNRMADKHDAKDLCGACGGTGSAVREGPTAGAQVCSTCKGTKLSWRNTYAHALRRQGGDLVDGSAAGLQWGHAYRAFHVDAVTEMLRVTATDGLLVINMSNHLRTSKPGGPQVEQRVVEWWTNELLVRGCRLVEVRYVSTRRQRKGRNGEARVDGERIIVVHTPTERVLL